MAGNQGLDAKCILILGGNEVNVRVIASLLAANGAIVFISSANETTLKADLEYIREQVPGCSVTGTPVNITFANDIAEFFLSAEIALPKHDVLIYFPDKSVPTHEFMIAANRLFTLMANYKSGQIINIGRSNTRLPKHITRLSDLSKKMRKFLNPLGIKVVEMGIGYPYGNSDCASAASRHDLQKAHPLDIALSILHLLCQS
jgi:hypothetical protein